MLLDAAIGVVKRSKNDKTGCNCAGAGKCTSNPDLLMNAVLTKA